MTGKILNGFYWICGILLIALCSSCNEFDSFGADLLENGWINAKEDTTIQFLGFPADKDSSITYNNGTTLSSTNFRDASFPLGKMVDPIFGNVAASFGTQLRIIPDKVLAFLKSPVDSIILSLRYDTSLFYGKYQDPLTIRVYPLTEAYDKSKTYYSDHILKYDANNILGAKIGFSPGFDSLIIKEDVATLKLFPQLRISLDTSKFMSLLRSYQDSVFTTVDSFNKVFNGIAIVCDEGNGIISVQPEHIDSRITIYYHETSAKQSTQIFNMGSLAVKTPSYQIDNSNSIAGQCIDGSIPGDSLLCLQGFTGRDIRLTIPYDNTWNGRFINYAVLQFYVAVFPNDDLKKYSLPKLLEIFDISSGTRVAIDDVAFALSSPSAYPRIFGGNPIYSDVNGKAMYLYKMNITRHFQKSLKAKRPMELIISSLFKLESPARVVFFGPGSSEFPAKLILTYSE